MAEIAGVWLTSAEARKALKMSTCDLAHLRQEGGIRFAKKGNAYLYSRPDVESLRRGGTGKRTDFCPLDTDR